MNPDIAAFLVFVILANIVAVTIGIAIGLPAWKFRKSTKTDEVK